MRAAVELAGYTPSESDELRKAISKKKKEEIDKHRHKFVNGAVRQGMEKEIAEAIYSDWEEFARYGFNKCLPGDVEVLDASTGRLVRIEDLYRGAETVAHTLSCDISSLKLQNRTVTRVMDNGRKPVFRLTTALGRTVEATDNHPFYTVHGWRQLGELQPDDFIAVPRVIPVEGRNEWHDHEAIALGHLLAGGNLCHPHSVYFYSQDEEQVDDFVQAANAFENVNCTIATHKSTYSIYAARADKSAPPGIFTWCGEIGLLGRNARTKEIPAPVFELTNRQIGLMISRMWEGDGHIDVRGRSMYYATASRRMAAQLQHLLLRFGVISRIRTVEFPYKEGRIGHQVFVTGFQNIVVFAENIGCYFVSRKRRSALMELTKNIPPAAVGTKDVIPVGAVKDYVRSAKDQLGLTWDELTAQTGIAPREFHPTNSAGKVGFGRNTLQRLGNYFDDPNIKRYAESDLYWDRVAFIEYVGEKQTYDLEIDETHNFIANDILVHNSHAADYGVIAVETAFLKAHYPAEYMAATLTASASQTEKVALYVADARSMGVPVLAPEVNASGWDFEIEDIEVTEDGRTYKKPHIRFGFGAVKNVGKGAVELIIKERDANGKFKDLNDFARRVDLRAVGKRALECIIKVGAMDNFGKRAALLASLDRIVSISNNHFRAAEAGQLSLFGEVTGVVEEITLPEVNNPSTGSGHGVDKREMLGWERELIGLYISDHPLTPYQQTFAQIVSYFSGQLNEAQHEEKVRVAGLVTHVRPYTTKTNKPMGFVTLEDIQGNMDLVLFPRTWTQYREQITVGQIVIVEGRVDANSTPPKILVDTVRTEIKILEPLSADKPPQPKPIPDSAVEALSQPKPDSHVKSLNIQSKQPKPIAPPQRQPVMQVAEGPVETYEVNSDFDGMPPPPDNFPDDWDTQWQPSFEEAAMASKPEPKFKKKEEVTPPRVRLETAPVELGMVEEEQAEAEREAVVTSLKSLYIPLAKEEDKDHPPKQITVNLRSSGDKSEDRRRIKTIYGTLISFHGRDRFSFQIFENGGRHLIDFPNDTTRICPELLARLLKLMGEESWRVEEITFQ